MITTLVFSPSDMSGLLIQADASISPENAANYGPTLLATALKYQINTPLRLAHWLAPVSYTHLFYGLFCRGNPDNRLHS